MPLATITSGLDIVAVSALGTHIADIDKVVSFKWHHRRHTLAPDFELIVAYDATALSDLLVGRVVRLKLNGTVVYSGVIEGILDKEVEDGEEADENITITGPPLASILDGITVRSQFTAGKKPWAKTRSFNFGCKECDVSSWPTATIQFAGWDAASASAHWQLGPSGFPDFGADWIGPDDGTDVTAPLGDCYYVADPSGLGTGLFNLGADTGLAFFEGADNDGPFLFDGLSLLNIDQFDTTQFTATHNATAFGSAGDHRYAAKISNPSGIDNTQNPTGLIACCFATDGSGALGALQWHTDTTFRILKRPGTPPGFTIGQILRILIQENQFEGLAPEITFGFTDLIDSAGNAWDTIENLTLNVNDSILKILQDLSQVYLLWALSDTAVLNVYRPDITLTASGVSYGLNADPKVSTLQLFERQTIEVGTDVLYVSWADGYVRVPASGGTKIAPYSTNATTEEEAVIEATLALALAQLGQPTQITTKIQPTGTGDVPGVDWVLANTIGLVPPSGAITESVEEWGGTLEDELDFDVTVGTVLLSDEERKTLWLQRMVNGTAGGVAPASPGGPAPPFQSQNSLSAFTFNWPDPLATGLLAKDNNLAAAANAYAWELRLQTAGTSDTTVELWLNGSVIATCTLGSGVTHAVVQVVGLVTPLTQRILPTDVLQANATAIGSGAAGLIGKPWFV